MTLPFNSILGAVGLNPSDLLSRFGLIGLAIIVFAESGLLVGFFLPGDSLLFAAGLLIATGTLHIPIWTAAITAVIAAAIGDQVGYRIGHRAGPLLFRRPRSRLFNPDHPQKAQEFFDRQGPKTVMLARFVPIVRTFVPVVAGVGRMDSAVFTRYNLAGAVVWGAGIPFAGWSLGRRFPQLGQRIDLVALTIVTVSLAPLIINRFRHQPNRERATSTTDVVTTGTDQTI